MPRPTKSELFDQARAYLDTDALNFPNTLLDILCKRVWFIAVTMEREWRFYQKYGSAQVGAGTLVPMTFNVDTLSVDATRLYTVYWNGAKLLWTEYTTGLARYDDPGEPVAWSELNDGITRTIRLFPLPASDGVVTADFFAMPQYPVNDDDAFADLPEEFDSALLEGLLADMYTREEDPDLANTHNDLFMQQMGSIRDRWRRSIQMPLVLGGRALRQPDSSAGFDAFGSYTQPAAP